MLDSNRRIHGYYVFPRILLHSGKKLNRYLHVLEITSEYYIHCVCGNMSFIMYFSGVAKQRRNRDNNLRHSVHLLYI